MVRMMSDVLLNIFYNLIGHRSKKQILLIFIAFYVAVRIHFKKRQKLKSLQRTRGIQIKDQVLITFSGGGQLGFYYQGICAYLRDNFDLENVRFAGISIGSTAASSLATKMTTEAAIVFGLKWFNLVSNRPLKLFLLPTSTMCDIGSDICDQFGITDKFIQQRQEKTDYYFGVTNFSVWPPKHELVSDFNSRSESFYAMSCSMRILPFFRTPGYFRKMWVLDGGFSAIFSIPKDADIKRIIKITPVSRLKDADVKPDRYSSNYFQVIDVFKMPSIDGIYKQFETGYNDAIRCRPKLIQKGLKLKSGGGYDNKLKQHMEMLRKHAKTFCCENAEELRTSMLEQDFSQFSPELSPQPQVK